MGWLGGKYTVVQQLHSFSSQWLRVNDCTYTYFFLFLLQWCIQGLCVNSSKASKVSGMSSYLRTTP